MPPFKDLMLKNRELEIEKANWIRDVQGAKQADKEDAAKKAAVGQPQRDPEEDLPPLQPVQQGAAALKGGGGADLFKGLTGGAAVQEKLKGGSEGGTPAPPGVPTGQPPQQTAPRFAEGSVPQLLAAGLSKLTGKEGISRAGAPATSGELSEARQRHESLIDREAQDLAPLIAAGAKGGIGEPLSGDKLRVLQRFKELDSKYGRTNANLIFREAVGKTRQARFEEDRKEVVEIAKEGRAEAREDRKRWKEFAFDTVNTKDPGVRATRREDLRSKVRKRVHAENDLYQDPILGWTSISGGMRAAKDVSPELVTKMEEQIELEFLDALPRASEQLQNLAERTIRADTGKAPTDAEIARWLLDRDYGF
jgi:hypothetical protein